MPYANRRRQQAADRLRYQRRRDEAQENPEADQRRLEAQQLRETRLENARIQREQQRQERLEQAQQRRREAAEARQERERIRQQEALSDGACAQRFETEINTLSFDTCNHCNERFFDLGVIEGECKHCRRFVESRELNLFTADNDMDPGEVPPELGRLSFVEQTAIARVHSVVSVYKLRYGQLGYTGQVINFPQEVNALARVLPHSIEQISKMLFWVVVENQHTEISTWTVETSEMH